MIVLDNIDDDNGGFKVKNRNTLQWDDLKLLQGDVLVMDGNTFHQSGKNNSNLPRRVYIGHYSTEPIGKNFQKGYYYKRFYGEHSKI